LQARFEDESDEEWDLIYENPYSALVNKIYKSLTDVYGFYVAYVVRVEEFVVIADQFVVDEVCVLRYDNEDGKGDHRHIRGMEAPYIFTDLDKLQADFWRDIDEWRP